MKSIFTLAFLFCLFLTTNAQADEIINSADMFAIPIVELQDTETHIDQIDHNDHEGLYIFDHEGSGQLIGDTESGYGESIGLDISVEGQALVTDIWGGDLIATTEWKPITGLVSLRRAGASGTHIQGDHYTPEGNDNGSRADLDRGTQTEAGLVGTGEVVGHRWYRL